MSTATNGIGTVGEIRENLYSGYISAKESPDTYCPTNYDIAYQDSFSPQSGDFILRPLF